MYYERKTQYQHHTIQIQTSNVFNIFIHIINSLGCAVSVLFVIGIGVVVAVGYLLCAVTIAVFASLTLSYLMKNI